MNFALLDAAAATLRQEEDAVVPRSGDKRSRSPPASATQKAARTATNSTASLQSKWDDIEKQFEKAFEAALERDFVDSYYDLYAAFVNLEWDINNPNRLDTLIENLPNNTNLKEKCEESSDDLKRFFMNQIVNRWRTLHGTGLFLNIRRKDQVPLPLYFATVSYSSQRTLDGRPFKSKTKLIDAYLAMKISGILLPVLYLSAERQWAMLSNFVSELPDNDDKAKRFLTTRMREIHPSDYDKVYALFFDVVESFDQLIDGDLEMGVPLKKSPVFIPTEPNHPKKRELFNRLRVAYTKNYFEGGRHDNLRELIVLNGKERLSSCVIS